jgi:prolyl-tRNA editing enzyme YbaK/EbsC (Cys-tRNA(Pro) deacylase)
VSTPAIAWLKQKKIPFDVIHYDHEEKGAVFAARSTGFPLEQTIKTLVTALGDKSLRSGASARPSATVA